MKKLFLFVIAAATALSSCTAEGARANTASQSRYDLLGTVTSISIYERTSGRVLEDAFKRVEEIHNKMALTEPGSEVNSLNNAVPQGSWVTLSDETAYLIKEARGYSALTGGAFDISVGPLVQLWNVSGEDPQVPGDDSIRDALKLVGYNRIESDAVSSRVRIGVGMSVDLGAVAKGYACGEAVKVLEDYGVKRAVLDFGGNIYAMGEKEGGAPWRIGVRNPAEGGGELIGVISVKNKAVVTSGGYERFFIQDGVTYHHIIDPSTGYPADSGVLSATIICGDPSMADALSTACFVMGADKGLEMLKGLEGTEGIFVCGDFTVRMTKGAADMFSLEDSRFDFVEEGLA